MRSLASAVALVLLVGCGGSDPDAIYEVPPGGMEEEETTLPAPVPAMPAFVLEKQHPLTGRDVALLENTQGVAAVARVTVQARRVVRSDGSKVAVKVAAVDPLSFRNVAPPTTRDAEFIWSALVEGDAIATHAAAGRLQLDGTTPIRFALGDRTPLAALVDLGKHPIAGVILSEDHSEPDRDSSHHLAIVGAEAGATMQALGASLRTALPDARIERLLPKTQATAPALEVPPPAMVPIPGLHPALGEAVDRLTIAAEGRVWVVSGHRSTEHQQRLWLFALRKYGSPEAARKWVAPPGHSLHERGLAVDLGGDLALAVRLVEELDLPLWRPMTWEPWHFELVGSR